MPDFNYLAEEDYAGMSVDQMKDFGQLQLAQEQSTLSMAKALSERDIQNRQLKAEADKVDALRSNQERELQLKAFDMQHKVYNDQIKQELEEKKFKLSQFNAGVNAQYMGKMGQQMDVNMQKSGLEMQILDSKIKYINEIAPVEVPVEVNGKKFNMSVGALMNGGAQALKDVSVTMPDKYLGDYQLDDGTHRVLFVKDGVFDTQEVKSLKDFKAVQKNADIYASSMQRESADADAKLFTNDIGKAIESQLSFMDKEMMKSSDPAERAEAFSKYDNKYISELQKKPKVQNSFENDIVYLEGADPPGYYATEKSTGQPALVQAHRR